MLRSAAMQPSARPLLAPPWHTALMVALLVAGPLLAPSGAPSHEHGWSTYLPLVATEAMFVLLVWLGLRLRDVPLRELMGRALRFSDLPFVAAGFALVTLVELALPGRAPVPMLPTDTPERVAWIAVAVSAAVGEEILFRGYFQQQLAALTSSRLVGLLGQAALFAVVHADQGALAAGKIAIYGLLFGLIVRARQSLAPAMLCHALIDLASGLWRV